MPAGRPLKFTPEELKRKIDEFWIYIESKDKPATLERLYCFLDCDKELLNDYELREEFSETVKKAKRMILADKMERLQIAKNPAGIIFDLKNNHGMVDKQELSMDIGQKAVDLSLVDDDVIKDYIEHRPHLLENKDT